MNTSRWKKIYRKAKKEKYGRDCESQWAKRSFLRGVKFAMVSDGTEGLRAAKELDLIQENEVSNG